jgi:hypothetical protein
MPVAVSRLLAGLVLPALLTVAGCAEQPGKAPAAPNPALETTSRGNLPSVESTAGPQVAGVTLIAAKTTGIAVPPLSRNAGRGELILHGGGIVTRDVSETIVAHAGPEPRICLIETYKPGRGESARLFRRYSGVALTGLFLDGDNVGHPAVLEALADCNAYFFDGGDPQQLSTLLRPSGQDTPALAVIRRRFEEDGALISGSSAGAMIAGPVTLCECAVNSSVQAVLNGRLFRAPGFEFLSYPVMIDAHFFARGLMGRHLFALARDRVPAGVGIDEDAAVLISADQKTWRVIGDRRVALIFTPPQVTTDKLTGFGLALLAPGDVFDPASATMTLPDGRRPVRGSELSQGIREAGLNYDVDLPITYDFEVSDNTIILTNSRTLRPPRWLAGDDSDSVLNAKVGVRPAV